MAAAPATTLERSRGSAVDWKLVGPLWLAFFLNYADRQAAFSAFPALSHDLGFTATQLSLIGTLFIWSYAAAMPVAGRMADRWPPSRLILSSMVLWSLAILGTAWSRSPVQFLVCRALMGLSEAVYFPAAVALLASRHGDETRSQSLAWHQSAQFAGAAAGGWFGGWSADTIGWRGGFQALAILGIIYAALLGRILKAERPERRESGATDPPGGIMRPAMLWLMAGFFFYCGALWMLYAWLPSDLHARFSLSMTSSGTVVAALQVAALAGVVTGGYWGDRTGRRVGLCAAGLIVSPLFIWGAFAAPLLPVSIASAICFGLTSGLLAGNVFSGARDIVGAGRVGLASGLLNALGGLAAGLGILAAGQSRETFGIAPVVAAAAGAAIICGIVLLIEPRWHNRRIAPDVSRA